MTKSVNPLPGCIYFLRAGARGPIKIGYAIDPLARATELQCACPSRVVILATIPGMSRTDERAMHFRFSDDWKRGEWFNSTSRLLECISKEATRWVGKQVTSGGRQPGVKSRVTRNITLPEELAFRAAELAAHQCITLSEMVERLLAPYVAGKYRAMMAER